MTALPKSPDVLSEIKALIEHSELGKAKELLLALPEQNYQSYEMLGMIALRSDNAPEAIARFQQAIMSNVKAPSGHYYLGLAQQMARNLQEALQSYARAASLEPMWKEPLIAAIQLLATHNMPEQAIPFCVRLCQIAPEEAVGWQLYNRITLNLMSFYEVEKQLLPPMELALKSGLHRGLSGTMLRHIQFSDWMRELTQMDAKGDYEDFIRHIRKHSAPIEFLRKVQDSPLLLTLMRRGAITFATLETILTQIRRTLLLEMTPEQRREFYPLLCAFWALGFNNEYVFYAEADEAAAIEKLRQSLQQAAEIDWVNLALLSSYTPLHRENFAAKILNAKAPDEQTAELVKEQLSEPQRERELAEAMPQLCEIADETSQKVRAQYEDAPYPRWRELPNHTPITPTVYASRMGFDTAKLESIPTGKLEVLVAGSGTGQHPLMLARSLTGCNVTAIDITLASLAYGQRKAEEMGVKNIKFMQADILKLEEMQQSFDMIESIGVLHHMQDPVAGWRVLTKLLKPGGIMRIGLYSRKARECVTRAREEIAKRKLGDSNDAIRHYRRDLMQREFELRLLGAGKENALTAQLPKLFAATDFFSLSECRDLIFHVQEHQYDWLQIRDIIAELGLEFRGVCPLGIPQLIAFQQSLPKDDQTSHLQRWHDYEMQHPDVFNGMMQFWLQKA